MPGKTIGQNRSTANSRAQLRRAGLVFPEDARLREKVGRGLLIVDRPGDIEPPAIVRDRDDVRDEDIDLHVALHPHDVASVDEVLEANDRMREEELGDEQVEIEVPREAEKEEQMQVTKPEHNARTVRDDRMEMIKFGKSLSAFENLNEANRSAVLDILERAGALGLSIEALVEVLR